MEWKVDLPMAIELGPFRGVIRGRIIELEKDPGLREGDPVDIKIKLALPPGEALRRAAGGWDEEGLTLEQLLEEMRLIRRGGYPERDS
jgi:hypothetical protein